MSEGQKKGPIRIAADKAKQLYDQGNATILDVVDTDKYNKLSYKIKGAVRINPEDIADEYTQLPQDRTVLAY